MYIFSGAVREVGVKLNIDICDFEVEVRHPRFIGSITKNTIFHLVVLLSEI